MIPVLCANGATWASTHAAASAESGRVFSAIFRARQGAELSGLDPEPGLREPVGQLKAWAIRLRPGELGEPQRGGELPDRELRDQRAPFASDRDPGVTALGHPPRRGVIQVLDDMQVCPLHGLRQDAGFRGVGVSAQLSGSTQHGGCGESVGARAHGSNATDGHRQFWAGIRCGDENSQIS